MHSARWPRLQHLHATGRANTVAFRSALEVPAPAFRAAYPDFAAEPLPTVAPRPSPHPQLAGPGAQQAAAVDGGEGGAPPPDTHTFSVYPEPAAAVQGHEGGGCLPAQGLQPSTHTGPPQQPGRAEAPAGQLQGLPQQQQQQQQQGGASPWGVGKRGRGYMARGAAASTSSAQLPPAPQVPQVPAWPQARQTPVRGAVLPQATTNLSPSTTTSLTGAARPPPPSLPAPPPPTQRLPPLPPASASQSLAGPQPRWRRQWRQQAWAAARPPARVVLKAPPLRRAAATQGQADAGCAAGPSRAQHGRLVASARQPHAPKPAPEPWQLQHQPRPWQQREQQQRQREQRGQRRQKWWEEGAQGVFQGLPVGRREQPAAEQVRLTPDMRAALARTFEDGAGGHAGRGREVQGAGSGEAAPGATEALSAQGGTQSLLDEW